jgi:hypothetical protein
MCQHAFAGGLSTAHLGLVLLVLAKAKALEHILEGCGVKMFLWGRERQEIT